MSGARTNEILRLRWPDIDWSRSVARLVDSKVGARDLPLGPPAVALLQSLQASSTSEWVFPSLDPARPLPDRTLRNRWTTIRDKAQLSDCRVHDLRHAFASEGVAAGVHLVAIGRVLGHSQQSTTERYAHSRESLEREAAARISSRVDAALRREPKADVVGIES